MKVYRNSEPSKFIENYSKYICLCWTFYFEIREGTAKLTKYQGYGLFFIREIRATSDDKKGKLCQPSGEGRVLAPNQGHG